VARKRDEDWAEAKRLCRLSGEEVRMAQALGMTPRGLMKNRPSPSQRWKAPVGVWVRELYRKRFGEPRERRQRSALPPPPRAKQDRAPLWETADGDESWSESGSVDDSWVEPVSGDDSWIEPAFTPEEEIAEQDRQLLRRQEELRAAADYVTVALARLPAVQRVVLIGSVARPLEQCRVPGCGSLPFLRQHEDFVFDPRSLDPGRSTLLLDRERAFGPPSLERWQGEAPF
jgi:hypothetical protein